MDELEAEVEDIGDIVAAGQCGENAYYALYSSGKVLVKGTGAMYDYDLESNRSPFYRNDAVRSVVVSEGITTVGEDAFALAEGAEHHVVRQVHAADDRQRCIYACG